MLKYLLVSLFLFFQAQAGILILPLEGNDQFLVSSEAELTSGSATSSKSGESFYYQCNFGSISGNLSFAYASQLFQARNELSKRYILEDTKRFNQFILKFAKDILKVLNSEALANFQQKLKMQLAEGDRSSLQNLFSQSSAKSYNVEDLKLGRLNLSEVNFVTQYGNEIKIQCITSMPLENQNDFVEILNKSSESTGFEAAVIL
ncbi:MAG: hypothetical protein VX583_07970 [Bdellovibrionota bacterium]|nr:hypothetical protein [Pseudobdellovibrionaceae bacterium]|tara:strand:- start:39369 stop:39980 length:612 start_codon:yes stop_codon:yes gene_type:complete